MTNPIAGTDSGPPCNACGGTIYSYHWDAQYDVCIPVCSGCHRRDAAGFEPSEQPTCEREGWHIPLTAAQLRSEHWNARHWQTERAKRLRDVEPEYMAIFSMLSTALAARGEVYRPSGNDDDACMLRRGIVVGHRAWNLIEHVHLTASDYKAGKFERYQLTAFGWHAARAIAEGKIAP